MTCSLPPLRAARTALLVALVACGDSDRKPEAPVRAIAAPSYVKADVDFMQGMIMHHGQAVVMAAFAQANAARASVRLLAEKISVSQRDEIRMMQVWLTDRKLASVDPNHDMGDMLMPGMLTKEQMAQLEKARGAEFDRLFLTGMIQHHGGALTMVKDLFSSAGAGQESEMFRFASEVDADQRTEIARMQSMLKALPLKSSK